METLVAEKKVPLDAQKEQFLVATFLMPFLEIFYGTEDHLGSTRMVLNAQSGGGCLINRAMMYQPYGSVSEVEGVGATSTDPLRQKFTTKELEMAKKETGITIVVAVTNVPPVFEPVANCKPYMQLNFGDGKHQIVDIQLWQGGLFTNGIKECYFDDEKTITSIELHAEGTTPEKSIHYIVNSLNQTAHIGKELVISLVDWNTIALMGSNPANHYSFSEWDAPELVSEGVYYFGARFHDPEIGMFLSTDPDDVYWNSYNYVGGNPINLIDPDGRNPLAPVLVIGQAATTAIDIEIALLQLKLWGLGAASTLTGVGTAVAVAYTGIQIGHTIYNTASAIHEANVKSQWEKHANLTNSPFETKDYSDFLQQMGSSSGSGAQSGSMSSMGWAQGGDPNNFNFDKNGRPKPKKIKDGPKFRDLKDHARRHSNLDPNSYYNRAVEHMRTADKFTFRHNGMTKTAHISRLGSDSFRFTSSSTSGNTIFTHMDVNLQYFKNIGIKLPIGF